MAVGFYISQDCFLLDGTLRSWQMGLRCRRRIKLGNGIWLNLSGSGVSLSMGRAGDTVNLSSRRGATAIFGIPGTGFSYQTNLGPRPDRRPSLAASRLPVQLPPGRPIQSAAVEEIAEISMQDRQQLILETTRPHKYGRWNRTKKGAESWGSRRHQKGLCHQRTI